MTKFRFFDLDGTITESRQVISSKMKEKILSLGEFVVISGAEVPRIEKQIDGVPCVKMGQNGNDTPFWKNKLTAKQIVQIYHHLTKISKLYDIPITRDTYHNRGCQVSFSFTGHNADINWKKKFDPEKKFRNDVLERIPFKVDGLTVRVAGTTCLDYNRKGNLKGDNLKRYMKLHGLDPKDCIYYGDNFDKGGNDESVLGVMECVEVKSPDDLYKLL